MPANAFGAVPRYASGQVITGFGENFRSDGKRWDKSLGTSVVNYEIIGYFAWDNPADDECSGKLGGGKHSSGSTPKCYDIGVDLRNGKTRLRTEEDHPNGYENVGAGSPGGVGMSSKFIGYDFLIWNQSNGVKCEVHQDTGNNESTASNQWKKIGDWLETSKNWQSRPSDHQGTIRIDGPNGAGGLRYKSNSITAHQINSGDTAGSGGSPGGGGGGGGLSPFIPTPEDANGDGYIDPGQPNAGEYVGGTPNPDYTGGDTGSGTPGAPAPPPPEPEIITVIKRYVLKWNIRVRPESCNSASETEPSTIDEIYTCPDGSNDATISTIDMYKGGPCTRIGAYVALDKSVLLGDLVKEFLARVKRVGVPPGFCWWEIYDRDNNLKYITPSALRVECANIPLNYGDVIIQDFKQEYVLQLHDKVVFVYEDVASSGTNKLVYKFNETDAVDGPKTCLVIFDGTKWVVDPTKDFSGAFGGRNRNA